MKVYLSPIIDWLLLLVKAMTKDFGELEYGAIQGVSNQESSIDYEQFDFLSSHDEETFFEPLPDVSHCFDEQLCGKNGKRGKFRHLDIQVESVSGPTCAVSGTSDQGI